MYQLLIVDDERLSRELLVDCVQKCGVDVEIAGVYSNAEDALKHMATKPAQIILADIRMTPVDGLELARVVSENYPGCRIILESGYSQFEYARQALRYQVTDYLVKPIRVKDLQSALKRVCGQLAESTRTPQPLATDHADENARIPAELDRNDILQRARDYIAMHYHHNITRDAVAKEIFSNPSYLSRCFAEKMGIKFHEYLQRYRIERSLPLLETGLTIGEIAERVGYHHPKYYRKHFKNYKGCSPAEYRVAQLGWNGPKDEDDEQA